MNVLITLPNDLVKKIILGEKGFEMRKSLPNQMEIGRDGFFVVEKGTDDVRCWCRVDEVYRIVISKDKAQYYAKDLCVTPEFILNYAKVGTKVYLWKIGKRVVIEDLKRGSLGLDNNPQQFSYCPLSYGESY